MVVTACTELQGVPRSCALSSDNLSLTAHERGEVLVTEDWDAVAKAVADRMTELGMTQVQLAARAQVSPQTVREIQQNFNNRQRRPQTLTALSTALDWPANHLLGLLRGEKPTNTDEQAGSEATDERHAMRAQLDELSERLNVLDRTEKAVAEIRDLLETISARLARLENERTQADRDE